jgi:hypothetical protein
LAIDGGGIRGIIPASILVEIEELADGARIADLFDVIAGTSTGGILALGATAPDSSGRPRLGAQELLDIYVESGAEIFPGGGRPTWRQRLLGPSGGRHFARDIRGSAQQIGSAFGGHPKHAGNARYFATGLEQVLQEKLGDTPLGDAATPVVITAYDMRAGAPVVFRSRDVKGMSEPLMRDVARATSAGPTYFPPKEMSIAGRDTVLVDGGLAANNPAMLGYTEAVRIFPDAQYVLFSRNWDKLGDDDRPADIRCDPVAKLAGRWHRSVLRHHGRQQ